MILLVGLLFAVILTFFLTSSSSNINILLDIISLLAVLLPIVFFLCITKYGKTLGQYIKKSFSKNPAYSSGELMNIAAAAKNTRTVAMAGGLMCFIIGLCAIFANIGSDDLAQILMRNLSVALVSVVYSVMVGYFVFFPLQAWAERSIVMLQTTDEGG